MLIILACLAGVLLGLVFNVVVLLPVTLAGALIYASFGAVTGALLIPAISLQAGYMIGLTSRDMVSQLFARLNIAQSKRV